MSILLDIAVAALMLLAALLGLRRGFIKSLAGLVGAVFALALALTVSRFAAGFIFETWIRGALQQSIANALAENGAATAEGIVHSLPGFLSGFLGGEQQTQVLENAVNGSADAVSRALLSILAPAITNLLMIVLTILLFLLLLIVVRLLLRLLNNVAKAPGLHQVNAVLGFFFGLGRGVLLAWVLCAVTAAVLPLFGEGAGWFRDAAEQSYLFRMFSGANPISAWFI